MAAVLAEVCVRTLNPRASLALNASTNASAEGLGISPASPEPSLPTVLEGRVRKVLQMVESGASFRIVDLALELRLSPSYLQRLF